MYYRYDAIVFDFDGTLVQSNEIKTWAFGELYKENGEKIVQQIITYHKKHEGVSRFVKFRYWNENLLGQSYTEEIGENKLPGALEYDSIAKTKVRDFNRITASTDLLTSEHAERINKSVLFKHLEKMKTWRKIQQDEKYLDLNIDNRRASKENAEAELLAMENDFRQKIGLNSFESYQAFLDREGAEEEPDIEEEILLEAANVLSDFIKYSYKPVISMSKRG